MLSHIKDSLKMIIEGGYDYLKFDAEYSEKALEHAIKNKWEMAKVCGLLADTFTVLDYGCNTGYSLAYATNILKCSGVGLDINWYALTVAKNMYPGLLFYDTIKTLKPESVDHIFLHHVLANLPFPKDVLDICNTILKKNGTISIITTNRGYKIRNLFSNFFNGYEPDETILRHYSWNSLKELLDEHFEVKYMEKYMDDLRILAICQKS